MLPKSKSIRPGGWETVVTLMKSVAFSQPPSCIWGSHLQLLKTIWKVRVTFWPLTQNTTCHSNTFGEYGLAPKPLKQIFSCGLEIVTALEAFQWCSYLYWMSLSRKENYGTYILGNKTLHSLLCIKKQRYWEDQLNSGPFLLVWTCPDHSRISRQRLSTTAAL